MLIFAFVFKNSTQLTLEQCRFDLLRCTYTQIFFNSKCYSTVRSSVGWICWCETAVTNPCIWSESRFVSYSCDPYSPWNCPGQSTGVGSLSLLQGIFPTQGLNPGLQHCRQMHYQLSHRGSPRILVWVACPFSSGSSQLRNRTGVSCIAAGFFTNWAIREALVYGRLTVNCTEIFNWV